MMLIKTADTGRPIENLLEKSARRRRLARRRDRNLSESQHNIAFVKATSDSQPAIIVIGHSRQPSKPLPTPLRERATGEIDLRNAQTGTQANISSL